MSGIVQLAAGKDRPVRQGHPWVFSGAIRETRGAAKPGDIVEVVDERGDWLARGYYNPKSQIVVRILTREHEEAIDRDFWARRLLAASGMRDALEPGAGHDRLSPRLRGKRSHSRPDRRSI